MTGDFVPGDGELARAIRSKQWSDTPLGALETWPEALRTSVSLCLGSLFPALVCWGPELLQIYNDAAIAILRNKHPYALGRSAREVWAELWPDVGPLIEQLMLTGESAGGEDMPLFPERGGAREQAFFTFSLSAIRGRDGRPAGMFVVVTETTAKKRAERERALAEQQLLARDTRHAFLLELGDRLRDISDAEEMTGIAAQLLGRHLNVNRVVYGEMEPDGVHTLVWSDWTDGTVPSARGRYELSDFGPELVQSYRRGELRRTNDTEADGQGSLGDRSLGIRSAIGVPMLKGGHLVAGMSIHSTSPRTWTDSEVQLVREVGERIWSSIERARAEAALRQSEERFRSIVHSARDYAIFLIDARGIITEWPEGAERVKGYSATEAIGQPISLFYTPAEIAAGAPERELAEAASEGRVERETWRVRKGGERVWVNEIETAVRDAAGNLVGFTRIARDITQKTQAAEALRQLAEADAYRVTLADALRQLAEADAYRVTLADALRAVSDPVEIQAVASRVLGQHLDVTRVLYAEIHGETSIVHRDYANGVPSLRGVHPLAPFDTFFREQSYGGLTTVLDDVSTDPRLPHTERQALVAYGIAAMVSVPLVKGGELRASLDVQHAAPRKWHAAELSRIEETAERTWLAVEQARAETLLRSSEEQFRLALDIETVGVVFFDLKGGIIRANDAFCRMTGYTQGDVEEQRLYFESLTSPESSRVRAKALAELEKLGVTATYEQQCLRKDGSTFWGLFAAKRLGAKQAVEFILDITERKHAEGALARAHADLEERVTRRTLELALTNRVLKNEVAQRRQAERLRTDLLRRLDSAQEDERRRVARDLHDQVGQTLTALTLAVRATRDAGALPPLVSARLSDVQRAAEDLGREVHELAVRLRPTALDDLGLHAALEQLLSGWSARTRIEVDCQLADLEAARLPPDFETVLYRVVQEALTNVARHARAARASVVVQRINGSVIAVVEDDGIGFEPHTATTDRLGLLGLSERVTLAGGTLSIESATGQGTTLIARLPC